MARNVAEERQRAATSWEDFLVTPATASHAVPVSQVVDGIATPWEDPLIWRWDRRRAITVQCSPNGVTAPTLRNAVLDQFEAIALPPGYRLDWDGEFKSKNESQDALVPGIVPAIVIMLFNANIGRGLAPYDAVVEGAVSRLNPVVNAAGTTVLGVLPMLQDVFWVSLAVTIFFGLLVGTMLTMVVGPTLDALLYRIPPR